MERWAVETAWKLYEEDPQLLTDYYRFWNIYKWNSEKPETDEWLLVAHTGAERAEAVRKRACDDWTYLVSPTTPHIFLYRNGEAVKLGDGGYASLSGTPPRIFEENSGEKEILDAYVKDWFGVQDRQSFAQQPLTPAQLETGEVIARAILNILGLFEEGQ
jgi:hypothetical protein